MVGWCCSRYAKRAWAQRRRGRDDNERPVSGKSVRHAWTVIAIALNRAKKQRIISFNPCEYVDAPRFERREMRALDAATAQKYIKAFSDDMSIGAAVVVAIGSGLRRGELLALRWSDVDLETGMLRVMRSAEARRSQSQRSSEADGRNALQRTEDAAFAPIDSSAGVRHRAPEASSARAARAL